MRVLGIVPARGASVRVPRKNVRLLGGRPLVVWAAEAALQSTRLARVVVSSEDDEVLAIAAHLDAALPLRRPAPLAANTSPAIDYVRHALETLEASGDQRYDATAIIQPTSPFTTAGDIDVVVSLLERSGAESAVSVVRVAHDVHPAKLKVMDGDRLISYLEDEAGRMTEAALPEVYVRNCSVYATARRAIERGQVITNDCRGWVMPRERSLDINDEWDLLVAEAIVRIRGDP